MSDEMNIYLLLNFTLFKQIWQHCLSISQLKLELKAVFLYTIILNLKI
jgi:hypothetical protein